MDEAKLVNNFECFIEGVNDKMGRVSADSTMGEDSLTEEYGQVSFRYKDRRNRMLDRSMIDCDLTQKIDFDQDIRPLVDDKK